MDGHMHCPLIHIETNVLPAGTTPLDEGLLHKVVFDTSTPLDAIGFNILHFRINNGRIINVPLTKFTETHWEFDSVALKPGDTISYFFTYSVHKNGRVVDCDSDWLAFTVPSSNLASMPTPQQVYSPMFVINAPPLDCSVLARKFEVLPLSAEEASAESGDINLSDGSQPHKIVFELLTPVEGPTNVDVHFRVNDGEQLNLRMAQLSATQFVFSGVQLKAGDRLALIFTVSTKLQNTPLLCDTDAELHTV